MNIVITFAAQRLFCKVCQPVSVLIDSLDIEIGIPVTILTVDNLHVAVILFYIPIFTTDGYKFRNISAVVQKYPDALPYFPMISTLLNP